MRTINTGRGRTYTKRKGRIDRYTEEIQDGKDDIQDGEATIQYGEVQIEDASYKYKTGRKTCKTETHKQGGENEGTTEAKVRMLQNPKETKAPTSGSSSPGHRQETETVSYTHLRAHET